MTELQPSPASARATPLGGAGLQAAWCVAQAAERAAATGHTQLCWAQLRAWPAWALADQPEATWLCVAGACWHAAEIKQCIDGTRLQALRDVLGAPAFAAVLRLEEPTAEAQLPQPPSHPLLNHGLAAKPDDGLAETLRATGRAVALASLADAELRAAVAAALCWPAAQTVDEGGAPDAAASHLPASIAQTWLALANEHVGA